MDTNTVGQRIRAVRLAHDMNQYEFADLLGVKQGTISHIELDRNAPSAQIVRRIAARFGVSVDELIGVDLAMAHDAFNAPVAESNQLRP